MVKSAFSLAFAAAICCLPVVGSAQVPIPGAALAEAQARLACGAGTVLNATYLPGGLMQVTCQSVSRSAGQSAAANELPTLLEGTALTPGVVAGGVISVVVVGALLGDDDTGVTSTTTTTTSSSVSISE